MRGSRTREPFKFQPDTVQVPSRPASRSTRSSTLDLLGGVPVKLGCSQIDRAAQRLLEVANRVDTAKRHAPAALGVSVGAGYCYVGPDGVHVIPIATIGP